MSKRYKKQRVYFIMMGSGIFLKIGIAHNPGERRDQLQTGNPFNLRLLKHLSGGRTLETYLHKEFDYFRVRGSEWFYPNIGLVFYMISRGVPVPFLFFIRALLNIFRRFE